MSNAKVFITPINNITISYGRYKILQIGEVYFVSKDRLSYFLKKHGVQKNQSLTRHQKDAENQILTGSDVFAVMFYNTIYESNEYKYIKDVQNAIFILCLAEFGYAKRRTTSIPSIRGMNTNNIYEYQFIENNYEKMQTGWKCISSKAGIELNDRLVAFHKNGFFSN